MNEYEQKALGWFFAVFKEATEENKMAYVDEPYFAEAKLLEGMGYLKFQRNEAKEIDEDFEVVGKQKVYLITPKGFEMIHMSNL